MADPTKRFSDRVADYVRYRPSYPKALIAALVERASLNRDSIVADIGSGTGIFTQLLLPHVGTIYGIEPNAAMRLACEQTLGVTAGFHSIDGTAEATTLPDASVDLITAAQAFHWFNIPPTRDEFVRILKPDGQVALIWNERLTETTPFLAAYEQLLKTDSIDYDQVNHSRIDQAAIGQFFSPGSYEEITFSNEQRFDYSGLVGRALSSSYVPNRDQPGHSRFFEKLQRIFDQHAQNGAVAFQYITRLYLGKLS